MNQSVKTLSQLAKIVQAHRDNTMFKETNKMLEDINKATGSADVGLSADERAEFEELKGKSYLRERHKIQSEEAVDYTFFRCNHFAEKEGISFTDAADRVLAAHPEYKKFRLCVTKDTTPSAYVDPEEPTRPSDRYDDQWSDSDKALDMLRRHETNDAIDYMRRRTEERKSELAGKLFGNR